MLYDPFKNDVYSLGLTLLFIAQMKSVDGVNSNPQMADIKLNELQKLNLYDQKLLTLIRKMLTWEENKRPPYNVLLELL